MVKQTKKSPLITVNLVSQYFMIRLKLFSIGCRKTKTKAKKNSRLEKKLYNISI